MHKNIVIHHKKPFLSKSDEYNLKGIPILNWIFCEYATVQCGTYLLVELTQKLRFFVLSSQISFILIVTCYTA